MCCQNVARMYPKTSYSCIPAAYWEGGPSSLQWSDHDDAHLLNTSIVSMDDLPLNNLVLPDMEQSRKSQRFSVQLLQCNYCSTIVAVHLLQCNSFSPIVAVQSLSGCHHHWVYNGTSWEKELLSELNNMAAKECAFIITIFKEKYLIRPTKVSQKWAQ